ncbi:hypothetical protein PIB30_048607 [Stylosanthes scabra]|uniref:Uncharacterized protein n=1 Tax=Stylosanthes scabra TaxID=79078 RepID=A0ABU6RHF7_9FABA|nr:hypothetical protein [Stylosanthes scabra]
MGNGVIYYEYEKREKFEDYDMKADAELGTFNIRHYHFGDESFVHPLHSVRFDPNRPYEIPIEALVVDQPLSFSGDGKSSTRRSRSSRRPTPHYSPKGMSSAQLYARLHLLRELVPPVVGWQEGVGEENLDEDEEDEDPEEEIPASFFYLWISMLLRTTYSSSRSWSDVPSILLSAVVPLSTGFARGFSRPIIRRS